jgi:hypothetical protein
MLSGLFGLLLISSPAWPWYTEGHQIVAIIAANGLTPSARSQAARILGVPDKPESVTKAMADASIRPDTEFRKDSATPPWHYIAICLQDRPADLPARCPGGNCVTAKIDEYAKRLHDSDYDKWGAAGDFAFLIHFVGDIYEPLHAATNADRNGICQRVEVVPAEDNLHYAWDDAVVTVLEKQLGTHDPKTTDRAQTRGTLSCRWQLRDLETRFARSNCVGIASTGDHGCLSSARNSRKALLAILRSDDENSDQDEPGLYGP